MIFTKELLETAHQHSINHRSEIQQSAICGCFHCKRTFASSQIAQWVDDPDGTALCPKCGIDSVIGSASGLPVQEPTFLAAMRRRWF